MEFSSKKLRENPRSEANFVSRIFFWWVNPFFALGFKRDLEVSDLYKNLDQDRSKQLGDRLQSEWDKELEKVAASSDPNTKTSLLLALLRTFGFKFSLLGIFTLIEECFLRIGQPLCLGRLLRFFSPDSDIPPWEAYLYALGVIGGSALYTFTHHPYFFGVQHTGMKMRVACCSLLYRKCLKLSKSAMGKTTVGQMVNLLSNDVNRFDQSVLFLHYLWVGPMQALITLAILWTELGPSCLAGLAVLILFVPFQGWLGKVFSRLRLETAIRTDERIRTMNEIISGMRVIKMYTWEKPFASLIDKLRGQEIAVIRKTAYYRALNMTLFFVSSKLIVFITFLIYVLTGNLLTSEKVFVTITLYNNIRLVMTLFFPFGVTQAAETQVSIKRLQEFLLLDEKSNLQPIERPMLSQCGVWLDNITAKWSRNSQENALTNITCKARPGQLLAIIGPVGSGKSSLLHAVLGELFVTSGTSRVTGKVAYASQEPWVFTGTVQQNILCGQPYNPQRYRKVIKHSALEKDLTLLPYGDQTAVGERGVSLSGGQKARVNLARALYVDADIYLLDDPLSAVDTHVGRQLFDESIVSFLRSKIRILVTHQLQYLKDANQILILKNGHVEAQGTFEELMKSGVDFAELLKAEGEKDVEEEEEDLEEEIMGRAGRSISLTESELENSFSRCNSVVDTSGRRRSSAARRLSTTPSRKSIQLPVKPALNEEMRSRSGVSKTIYSKYFTSGGGVAYAVLLVLSNIAAQLLFSGSDYWLTLWTGAEEKRGRRFQEVIDFGSTDSESRNITYDILGPNETSQDNWLDNLDTLSHVYIYSSMIIVLFAFAMLRTVLFFLSCMKSSINLHKSMFNSVIRAPTSFFDSNPVGRTLNRFSKDMGTMDEYLPVTFFDFITILLSMVGVIVIVVIINYWLILPFALLALIFFYLRRFYLKTARDVKRLEGITRSPVFSHLSTSLIGLTTIRAHQAESIFQHHFDEYQDVHSSAWYMFLVTTRWFGIWLDWISVIYVATVTIACVALHGTINSSMTGLVISSAIALTGAFQWGVRQSAETENQMTSVERILEYTALDSEKALESTQDKKPSDSWPEKGQIKFEKMFLAYSNDTPPVLKDINCVVRPNEKVGIVGRTGAGKSSLITALFRLTEPEGLIEIDGVNIKEIGLHDLRSRIAIIPQDPVLFTGTLRYNLDPFSRFTDEALWRALEEVKLKEAVGDLSTGLNTEVAEGGSNFSVGQRQLICLARAILSQNRILVLDEATANVDPKTDALIQETIRKKFADCTVLTIAHRLNTIMDSDRIMVLDAGYLKAYFHMTLSYYLFELEFEDPLTLLSNTTSIFYGLVEQTGKQNAELLREMAEKAQAAKDTYYITEPVAL